jgi:hypothetical protein
MGASHATDAIQTTAEGEAVLDDGRGVAGSPGGGESLRKARLQAERRTVVHKLLPGHP